MNTTRKLNLGALICNSLVVLLGITGLIFTWISMNFWSSLSYFTISANVYLVIATSVMIYYNICALIDGKIKTPQKVFTFYLSAIVAIAMSLFAYEYTTNPFSSFQNVILYLVTPIIAIISYLFFAHSKWLEVIDFTTAFIPTGIYVVFYLIYVSAKPECDMYHLIINGQTWSIYILAIPILGVTVLISFLFALCHNTFHEAVYNHKIILSNGVRIPTLGLGTWQTTNEEVGQVIKDAIKIGYKHIDTAQAYGNESGIGKAVKESGIKRSDIFITSKVAAEIKTYEEAKKSIKESLKKLQTDYIDLMLIHCPQPWAEYNTGKNYDKENIEVWKALEEAYKEKKIRAIGVSNFNKHDLKNLFDNCEIRPMVNQICVYPGNTPFELIDFCKKNFVAVEAYSPIATGRALNDVRLKDLAMLKHVTIPRLCIRYTLNLGLVSLPKARSVDHLKENFNTDIYLSFDQMELMKSFVSYDKLIGNAPKDYYDL